MIKDDHGDDVIPRFADFLIFIAPSCLCLYFLVVMYIVYLSYQKSVGIIYVRL